MKASCKITIEYKDRKVAETVLRAIKVDDSGFVDSKIIGSKLEAAIESKSISSLIHTLDDYLSCVSVAEKIVDKS